MMMEKQENEAVGCLNFFSQGQETCSAPPETGAAAIEIWFWEVGLREDRLDRPQRRVTGKED